MLEMVDKTCSDTNCLQDTTVYMTDSRQLSTHVASFRRKLQHHSKLLSFDWLSMVLRLRQHNIGYTADGFYRSDDPTNSVKALNEGG